MSMYAGRRFRVEWRDPDDGEWLLLGVLDDLSACRDLVAPYRVLTMRIVENAAGAIYPIIDGALVQ